MVHPRGRQAFEVEAHVLAGYGGDEVGRHRPGPGTEQGVEGGQTRSGVVGATEEAQHVVLGRLHPQAEPVEAHAHPGLGPGRGHRLGVDLEGGFLGRPAQVAFDDGHQAGELTLPQVRRGAPAQVDGAQAAGRHQRGDLGRLPLQAGQVGVDGPGPALEHVEVAEGADGGTEGHVHVEVPHPRRWGSGGHGHRWHHPAIIAVATLNRRWSTSARARWAGCRGRSGRR